MERPAGDLGTEREAVPARALAFGIDTIVSFAIVLGYVYVLLFVFSFPDVIGVSLGLLLYAAYFAFPEALWGQTPGKRICGVVVVADDGSPADGRAILMRTVFRAIDGLIYYLIGLLVILGTYRAQRLGDLMAETVVVRVKE